MSTALRFRVTGLLASAAVVVACGGGTGPVPTVDSNPFDSPGSSFEAAAEGPNADEGGQCFPCDVRLRCQQGDESNDVTVPCPTAAPSRPPSRGGDDDDDDDVPPPGLRQSNASIAFRCGGIVEARGQRVGSWTRSGNGWNVCIDALGSGTCFACGLLEGSPRPTQATPEPLPASSAE